MVNLIFVPFNYCQQHFPKENCSFYFSIEITKKKQINENPCNNDLQNSHPVSNCFPVIDKNKIDSQKPHIRVLYS